MTVWKPIGRILSTAAAAAAIWLFSGTIDHAHAQATHCSDRQTMVTALNDKFKESRQGIGLVSNQRMMELYVSGTGSWTVLFTHPNGMSCIGATGNQWETMPMPEIKPPAVQSNF